ncbi:MAG TPA: aspartyl protease family protein [Caulobacteraceae bacterium]|nr:aspartyl protease family protein [Caulobacteraceae bacterium]
MPLAAARIALAMCLIAGGLFGLTTTAAAQAPSITSTFRNGLVFVEVQVNGASGLFLLDTGAAASVFDPRFAGAAGVRLGRIRQVEGRGGEVMALQGQAVDLALPGGPRARVSPVVTDLSAASSAMGVPLAGILGEDFLQGFVLTLDYRDQTVALARDARAPADATPIRLGATPYVTAEVLLGDHMAAGDFEIDTGSNTAVEFWAPFARSALGEVRATRDIGLGVAGESIIERGRIDALDVAGRRITAPQVNFADETPPAADAGPRYAGVIGGPAWNGLVLTLDLPHRRMWLR